VRGDASGAQVAAQLQSVRSAALRGQRSADAFHADFENYFLGQVQSCYSRRQKQLVNRVEARLLSIRA